MDITKRLGDAELEIMQVIWRGSEPFSSTAILGQLHEKRKWALSTLMTSLARLVDKGFIACDRSTGQNLYSALIPESQYKSDEGKSFLSRVYGNSVAGLVSSLYDGNALSDDDIAELRQYLDKIAKE